MTSGRQVIDGRFELLDRLGSGGMGAVWKAMDLVLQREVALKEVRLADPGASQDDPETAAMLRERVLIEARALARLDHPNVVTIHHIVDSPGMAHPWLVMELVRGQSLKERLDRGPLPPAEAATIGRGILAALTAAHAAGICHRDVKPANVLLRTDGSPVLTDFGIAALNEAPRVTVTGGLVGSPEYIAPERLHGEEGNPASDLWSLGVLLYTAVEGRNPMRRSTATATLAAVMTAQVPPPVQAGPLAPVLAALLVPDPAARPSSAQLDHLLAQAASATPAPYPSPPPPVTPPPFQLPGPYPQTHSSPVPHTSPRLGRPPRRAGTAVFTAMAAAISVVAVLAFTMVALPELREDNDDLDSAGPRNAPSGFTSEPRGTAPGEPEAGPANSAPADLLTPDAIRKVIAAFEKATGGNKFTDFTVHEEHASAEAPVKGNPKVYDRYAYRDGEVTRTTGSTLSSDDVPVDLGKFNWDAVPALLKRADRSLGVPKPTTHYIIVDPSWAFANDRPMMLVYASDEYGGGYLAADAKGKVLRTYQRGG